MTAFRVIVTGSRDWTDDAAVYLELNRVVVEQPGRDLVVVHGACPAGPDMFASCWVQAWASERAPTGRIVEEPWPAAWDTYGNGAGMVRNTAMVNAGADLCLAFIATCAVPSCPRRGRHGTHGASDCATKALAAGIPLRPFGPWVGLFAQQALDLL